MNDNNWKYTAEKTRPQRKVPGKPVASLTFNSLPSRLQVNIPRPDVIYSSNKEANSSSSMYKTKAFCHSDDRRNLPGIGPAAGFLY